jgi:hypothetical protein
VLHGDDHPGGPGHKVHGSAHARHHLARHLPVEPPIGLLALQRIVYQLEELARVLVLLQFQQHVADAEAGDLVANLAAVEQDPQQPRIFYARGHLRKEIQHGLGSNSALDLI